MELGHMGMEQGAIVLLLES